MELNFIKSGDYYIPDIHLQNPNSTAVSLFGNGAERNAISPLCGD